MSPTRSKSSSSVQVFYPEYNREEVLRLLNRGVETLRARLTLLLVALFGSYARGDYTVASDIDVLVVYGGRPREDAYSAVKKSLDLGGVEPHVYSESEYREMRGTVDRMLRDAVTLFRAEGFDTGQTG